MKSSARQSEINTALRRAEEFAASAVERVLSRLEEDPKRPRRLYHEYARLVLGLEIHFLFPNLSAAERRLLVVFLEARNAIRIRKNGLAVHASRILERSLAPWEQRWRTMRKQVLAIQRSPAITVVQRAILRQLTSEQFGRRSGRVH